VGGGIYLFFKKRGGEGAKLNPKKPKVPAIKHIEEIGWIESS